MGKDLWLPKIKTAFPYGPCSWHGHMMKLCISQRCCDLVASRNLAFFIPFSFLLPGIQMPPAWTMRSKLHKIMPQGGRSLHPLPCGVLVQPQTTYLDFPCKKIHLEAVRTGTPGCPSLTLCFQLHLPLPPQGPGMLACLLV